jgi:hypothetical protein
MGLFTEDISDVMTRILVRRNIMWAAKIASQDTTATMHLHKDDSRCICESCSDARPTPKGIPSFRAHGRPPEPPHSVEHVGHSVIDTPRPPLNPPVSCVDLGNSLPFALRLMSGPNRKPAPVPFYEGTTLLKKGHF